MWYRLNDTKGIVVEHILPDVVRLQCSGSLSWISICTWWELTMRAVRNQTSQCIVKNIDQELRNKLHGPMHYTVGGNCVFKDTI